MRGWQEPVKQSATARRAAERRGDTIKLQKIEFKADGEVRTMFEGTVLGKGDPAILGEGRAVTRILFDLEDANPDKVSECDCGKSPHNWPCSCYIHAYTPDDVISVRC